MADQEIQVRTFEFSRRILRLGKAMKDDKVARLMVSQVLRSGTSIGANVEEAQGAQSRPDFIAKMAVARKEARETVYWLPLIQAECEVNPVRLDALILEASEILRVVSAIIVSARRKK